MRIIHIADVHLLMEPEKGTPMETKRKNELFDTFYEIIDICNRDSVDLLLIAGDLFHRSPRVRDLKEVDYRFSKLKGTRVVLIAGNHDYIGANSYYRNYPWSAGVHMLEEEEMSHVTFPDLRTTVYGFSYHTRDIKEARYDDVKAVGDGIQILLAHGGDPKDVPMNYKRIGANGFEYVALGHIHKPEILADNMAYAGSPEPLDKNETGPHGYMQVEITGEDGAYHTEISFVPLAKRQYLDLHLTVTGEDTQGSISDGITREIQTQGEENMYRIFLQGKRAADLSIDCRNIYRLGHVTEVRDETLPEYDFDAMYRQNADNLIGMYIQALRGVMENSTMQEDAPTEVEIAQKALYYGIEALISK